jgi:hypothetical protein
MGSQGPGDIPKVVRRRKARVQRQARKQAAARPAQPPSSTARQNVAFGSRPARALPKPAAPRPAAKPASAPRPTRTQQRSARAQQAAYVSQGKAVEKTANRQRQRATQVRAVARTGGEFDLSLRSGPSSDDAAKRAARKIGKPVVVGEDNHYYVKQKRAGLPDRHLPVDPFSGKVDNKYLLSGKSRAGKLETEAIQAPALKVLDQTTRPLHGVMASTRAGIKAHGGGLQGLVKSQVSVNAPNSKAAKAQRHAFQRGIELKDRSTGSDVLKDVGVKNKVLRSAGGFALDVVADPLTYATGRTGSIAARAGEKAATRVERRALKHGLDDAAAKRLAATAARQAEKAAPKGRGVTLRLGGAEVPGVRRATGVVARGARTATRKAVGDRLATDIPAAARNVVREMAPRVRAPGVTHEQMAAARSLARSGRARVSESATRADLLERDFIRGLKSEDKQRVVDAIERGRLSHIIAPTKKARDKLAREDPKEFKRRQALTQKVHRARSEMAGEYRKGLRSGAIQKERSGEFLTKGDLGKLDRTVKAEQVQQRRALVRAGRDETRAQHRAELTAQESRLRAEGKTRVMQERSVRTGREPKPVEPKVLRSGAAANRYERRAADTQLAQQRLAAAHSIPTRSANETPEAYLRRVQRHAKSHDLPLVARRAETLLAKKPATRARGYYPHITQDEIRHGEENLLGKLAGRESTTGEARMVGGGVARKARETRAGKRRVENEPLSALNPRRVEAGKAPYSTDVPVVVPNYIRQTARASQPAEFAKGIAAQVGRPLKPGETLNHGEELYRLGFKGGRYGLHKEAGKTAVPEARAIKPGETVPPRMAGAVAPRGGGGGQYVALPSNFFENIETTLAGTSSRHNMKVIQALDATQNLWKRGAITTAAFHVRNMIGDVAAGYNLPGVGGSLRHVLSAIKTTRRASESHRFLRPRTKAEQHMFERAVLKPNENSTLKVAGKPMPLDDFIRLGVENGVPDTGRIARDILGSAGGEAKLHARGRGRSITRPFRGNVGNRVNVWLTSRENVMRWAAFKHGLDQGMTPAEAADMASLYHIDYAEMSSLEREVLRRAMPFYTWTARTLPVMAKTMIQRPGKFANLEAAREETGKAFTGEDETAVRAAMPDFVKRQVPVVIRVGNSDIAVSASLPVTLLNEFPDPSNPGKFLDEAWHFGFGMVGPYGTPVPGVGVKQLAEIGLNKSFFTRRDIRPQFTAGRVPAPAWVAKMPDGFKKAVGAVQGPDKDTGKTIWYWDGRVDYGTHLAPGAAQQASQAAAGARPGQEALSTPANIASVASGIRLDKLGQKARTQAGRAKLAKELDRLNNQAELLNLQGIHHDNPTPEYKRVRARINAINKVLHPRKRKPMSGSDQLSPSDIGLGSTGSDLTPSDIGLGGG